MGANLGFRAQNRLPLVGVEHNLIARLDGINQVANAAKRGDAKGTGENGGVTGRAALLDDDAGDPAGLPLQQLRRA